MSVFNYVRDIRAMRSRQQWAFKFAISLLFIYVNYSKNWKVYIYRLIMRNHYQNLSIIHDTKAKLLVKPPIFNVNLTGP